MTRQEFEKLFEHVLTSFDIEKSIRDTKDKLLESGAIDLPSFDAENQQYLLPKAVFYAAINEQLFRSKPLTKKAVKIANNLKRLT